MNDVATTNGSTALATNQPNFFQQYGDQVVQRTIIGKLLKFTKGDYLAGEDNVDVPAGTEMMANLDELMVGWIRWHDNKPVEQIMGKISDGYQPPRRDTLGDHNEDLWEVDNNGEARDPWQLSNYLIMKTPGKNTEDDLYTFAASSQGSLKAVGILCQTYGKRIRTNADEFPIIALKVGSYDHPKKAYGRIKFPKLEVVRWASKQEFIDALNTEQAAQNDGGASTPAPKAATDTRF